MRKLTARQQRFIEEYCVSHNATQAAIEAGYSEKSDDAPPCRRARALPSH